MKFRRNKRVVQIVSPPKKRDVDQEESFRQTRTPKSKEVQHPGGEKTRASRGRSARAVRLREHPWWGEAQRPKSDGSIPLFWWHDHKLRGSNFGDALSPVVVGALAGRKVSRAEKSPKLLAIGSIAKLAQGRDTIWGSGFSMGDQSVPASVKVLAVRGPRTRDRMLKLGVKCPEVYGDPALLLPYIRANTATKKHKVGIVPHFVDFKAAKKMLGSSGFPIIDLLQPSHQTIKEICQCEVVYSSSLHGVIVAEAYGVPAVWVEFSDGVRGGGWKFGDYYATTGRRVKALDWRRSIQWGEPPELLLADLEPLCRAFPYGDAARVLKG